MSVSLSQVTGTPVGSDSFRPSRAPGIGETLRSLLTLLEANWDALRAGEITLDQMP